MITEPQTCSIAFFANLIEIIAIRFQIGQCFGSWNPRNHKVFHTGSFMHGNRRIPPFPHFFPVGLGNIFCQRSSGMRGEHFHPDAFNFLFKFLRCQTVKFTVGISCCFDTRIPDFCHFLDSSFKIGINIVAHRIKLQIDFFVYFFTFIFRSCLFLIAAYHKCTSNECTYQ